MNLFEQRTFLLDNGVKIVFLECIFDCLRCDRIGKCVVDEMGSLNSIIKLANGDLTNNWLLVTERQLRRTRQNSVSCALFLIILYLILIYFHVVWRAWWDERPMPICSFAFWCFYFARVTIWVSTLAVFFISIHLLLDSPNGRLPYTSFRLYLTAGITLLKK